MISSATILQCVNAALTAAFTGVGLPRENARASLSQRDGADYQCNGVLASKVPQPREVAASVAERLRVDAAEIFQSVEVAGPGFLNLRLADSFLAAKALEQASHPRLGVAAVDQPIKALIDFGGPNVAKPLHVGHLRSLVIGESLRRIIAELGHTVISDVHLGDWGLQMGMLITEIRKRWPDLPSIPAALPFDVEGLISLYPEAAAQCRDDAARMDEARQATTALQAGDESCLAIWRLLRDMSFDDQCKDFGMLGAHFDLLLGESSVQKDIPALVQRLIASGDARQSDGATVMDVEAAEDTKPMPPLLLAKADGGALYATTDLATLEERVSTLGVDLVAYVVDQRQELHFEQVFRAARKSGIAGGARLVHVGFGTVNGPNGKPYRTREGGVARLRDLLNEAVTSAQKRGELSSETAKTVGIGAIKFADLSSHRLSGYVFDPERFLAFEGRTGPYLQYACVRIASILAKAGEGAVGDIVIRTAEERALVIECLRYPDRVSAAFEGMAPSDVADQAFRIAQSFSKMYANNPVLNAVDLDERQSRLAICALAGAVLQRAAYLLGMEIPAEM